MELKMSDKPFFVDFHCHATLRALNTVPESGKRNMWEKTYNPESDTTIGRWARFQTREIAKESQTNFYDYAQGKTRVIFDSLYPLEKGWFNFRRLPHYMVGERSKEELMLVAVGVGREKYLSLRECKSYFNELKDNYHFVVNQQGYSPDSEYSYAVARSYDDVKKILNGNSNSLAVILNIEGGHALECGAPCTEALAMQDHKILIKENIEKIKSWTYPIFSINLAHHFDNQLCGHARSLKSPISLVFNQSENLDKGITELGWVAVENLLSEKKGNRILIDSKHMSVQSRKEYYDYIRNHNKQNPGDKIPLIYGHAGASGIETMAESISKPDNGRKFRGSYFNNWSINVSDEEINYIHESGGLIGVMLDKGLLGSPDTLKTIRALKSENQRKKAFITLLLDNIFHIVRAVGDRRGWDVVTMGSDFDGMITHMDPYPTASAIPNLYQDLLDFLAITEYKNHLWYGYSPEEILSKLFRENALNFLKLNFK